ncbi:MAG: zonular occludens toxin domain-containing protein [Steroidobacteraceae bacterium]
MAVTAYVGYPRSGKSYSAVEQVILPALREGRVVVTNLPVNVELLVRDFPGADVRPFPVDQVEASPERIFEFCPNGAVVVIDEAWRFWPAGVKVSNIPTPFKSFLAEHGHRLDAEGNSQQIVLVTQDLNQVAAFARQLVEETFFCRKLRSVGRERNFRTDVHQGHPTGLDPPERSRVRQVFGVYSESVWKYYTSHTMSEAGVGVSANETVLETRGNLRRRPVVYVAILAIFGLPVLGLWLLFRHGPALGLVGRSRPLASSSSSGAVVSSSIGAEAFSGRWWVSVRLDGLCAYARCGWAVVTDGKRQMWVSLIACRQVDFDFRCPLPGGAWASDENVPPGPPAGGPGVLSTALHGLVSQ